ncbi:MAG: glycosyltransferase family 2 protein [Ruminococcus flavefaciens]|nr:glycosyltransferase family 2 protein [Ruminococcus flavefaciens]MCM1228821.1 glycosyltransferase family 2 protein [Ruminococcus flavefaciens]
MKLVSVVVPCYNEQEVLPMFYEEITKVTDKMKTENPELEFEYLFINDGSKDRTLEIFRELAQKDKRVRYISFSRNFGKESGIYAGLKNSKGDYVVVMDADLQHPPAFLPQMYSYVKSGEYDCATTRRVSRTGESKVRSWFARIFYKIMNKISDTEIVDGAQDFRFMTRQMVNAILDMSEYNRFSKGIFSWVGFRVKYMPYENVERPAGTTSWSFWGLFKYSLEGIMAFSTFPLALSIFFGILCLILSVVILLAGLILSVVTDIKFGWFAGIASVFAVGGVQLGCTGIMGQYMSKMYLEIKKRPIYIAGETDEDYRNRLNNE